MAIHRKNYVFYNRDLRQMMLCRIEAQLHFETLYARWKMYLYQLWFHCNARFRCHHKELHLNSRCIAFKIVHHNVRSELKKFILILVSGILRDRKGLLYWHSFLTFIFEHFLDVSYNWIWLYFLSWEWFKLIFGARYGYFFSGRNGYLGPSRTILSVSCFPNLITVS